MLQQRDGLYRPRLQRAGVLVFLVLIISMPTCTGAQTTNGATHALQAHVRGGLPNFYAKLRSAGSATVAFFGGTALENGDDVGRALMDDWLREKAETCALSFVNAGVAGSGSELGAFRLKRSVLSAKPDLVVVDFAADDLDEKPESIVAAIEGIVRQARRADPMTDMLFITADSGNAGDAEETVADFYGLASIRIPATPTALAATSPTTQYDPITDALEHMLPLLNVGTPGPHDARRPILAKNLENVSMSAPVSLAAGWNELLREETPSYEPYRRLMPRMWQAEPGASPLAFKFVASEVELQVLSSPGSGTLTIEIDHDQPQTIKVDGGGNVRPHGRIIQLAKGLSAGEHRLLITPGGGPITIGEFLFVGSVP